jgi:5-hydroxyisourate hydrolase-like protein (transthyretin family)
MPRHNFLSAVALTTTLLVCLAISRSAVACMCASIEPDLAYQNAILVFTGTVASITPLTREAVHDGKTMWSTFGHIVRLTVQESFKGNLGTEIELRSNSTSCDIGFEVGKRYIVYAAQDLETGTLGASTCSRTRLLDDYAKPDISYLRRLAAGEPPTMLYGFAFKNTAETAKRGQRDPLGGLTITVEGDGKRLELKTDASGYFETFGLLPGSYRISTGMTGKLRGAEPQSVDLRTVASVGFNTTTMGSLTGRVLDQEGRPVRELHVELLQPGAQPSTRVTADVTTREDGTFLFAEAAPGRYLLAVNSIGRRSLYGAPFLPSYYPKSASSADAQVVIVADGVSIDVGDFVLQERYPTVAVSGIVMTSDGKPVSGAYVSLNKSGGEWDAARSVQTDADGRFMHQAFEGVIYILEASADAPTGGTLNSDRVEVVAGKGETVVRLVVKPTR